MARGGKRSGAGRRKNSDPTVTIRVPISQKEIIKQWLKTKNNERGESSYSLGENSTKKILTILQHALTLKANAGGKIKQEIRLAIGLMQSSAK
jgi:hypothetical protein